MEDLSKKKFFKITNREENHNSFQYTDGLNILKEPFAEMGSCVRGGLYFTDANNIFEFLNYGIHLREITLPVDDPDFKIIKDNTKWRANKIILGKKYNLWEKETFEYLVELGGFRPPVQPARIDNSIAVVNMDKVSIGADIHAYDEFPLGWASGNGYLDVVKYLVELGANIHAYDDCAVRYASENGHLDVVEYLVSVGANIHAKDDHVHRKMAV